MKYFIYNFTANFLLNNNITPTLVLHAECTQKDTELQKPAICIFIITIFNFYCPDGRCQVGEEEKTQTFGITWAKLPS